MFIENNIIPVAVCCTLVVGDNTKKGAKLPLFLKHCCPVNFYIPLLPGLPQAGRASYPQRRCVFLLGYDSAAASISAIAFFNFRIKLTENEAAYAGTDVVQSIQAFVYG